MSATGETLLPPYLAPKVSSDWRRSALLGYGLIFGAIGTFCVWASFARIDGAAIAPGVVAAETNRKTVQHLEGGIVREILIRDGERVAAGQPLVRLDLTRVDAQGDLYENQYAILLAQEARLLAEFKQNDTLAFPEPVVARQDEAAVAPVVADQRRLFESRRNTLERNLQIADAQIEQARTEAEQLKIDVSTAKATLEQVDDELRALRPLQKRNLVPTTRVAPLERERLRLAGIIEGGSVQARKVQERLDEVTLRRQQIIQDYRQEASTLLLDVRQKLNEVQQQRLLIGDSQRRAEIRAPIAGVVQQLRVFTVGGVIRPGDAILDIAPENDELVIRAKVQPNDSDRVLSGMTAEVRFPAFSYWGQKAIHGKVRSISGDRIVDDQARESYFSAEILVDKATVPQNILARLSAGMSADVLITSGERTVAEYLLQPITARFDKGLRER